MPRKILEPRGADKPLLKRGRKKRYTFQMRVSLVEREQMKRAAAFADRDVSEYIWGLHVMRTRGELMPNGAAIIIAATKLLASAKRVVKTLEIEGMPLPELQQRIDEMTTVLEENTRSENIG